MRWPLVSYKKFASTACVAQILLGASLCHALDDQRLWLPANHQRLFLDLKDAALAAETLTRCTTVLEGTIDLDESTHEHPIYRILCRQDDGLSYNELVDGLNFKTLTTKIIETPPPTKEDLEALQAAEEKAKEQTRLAKLESLWRRCEEAINKKVALMNDVEWKSSLPAVARELSAGAIEFLMDFDAKSLQGAPLRYHARCQFLADGELTTKIYARK